MAEWWPLINLSIPVALFLIGYIAGSIVERAHFHSLEEREAEQRNRPVVTFRTLPGPSPASGFLVTGSAVISLDYFKRIVAGLRNLVGGRVSAYETLVDRARREALLRMCESAPDCDLILNVRIETSTLDGADGRNSIGSVEALAYGTAVVLPR